MSKQQIYIDQMIDHFEEAMQPHYFPTHFTHPEEDQPQQMSWIHFWCSNGGLATDQTFSIEYKTAEEFQQKILEAVTSFFSPTALQLVREGKIHNFGMQIGPEQPSGGNINDELGLEVKYDTK
jgi:hypothetical protein